MLLQDALAGRFDIILGEALDRLSRDQEDIVGISPAELRRVGEVLREMEAEGIELPSAILAVRLLILTGCRLSEIMTLKWEYVDLEEGALRLPDSKTGAKVVHLGRPAIEQLKKAKRIEGNPWVIFGTLKGKRLSDLQPFWQRVRAAPV